MGRFAGIVVGSGARKQAGIARRRFRQCGAFRAYDEEWSETSLTHARTVLYQVPLGIPKVITTPHALPQSPVAMHTAPLLRNSFHDEHWVNTLNFFTSLNFIDFVILRIYYENTL
jgi:hypothetical protein